jgi:hypothetical protein
VRTEELRSRVDSKKKRLFVRHGLRSFTNPSDSVFELGGPMLASKSCRSKLRAKLAVPQELDFLAIGVSPSVRI